MSNVSQKATRGLIKHYVIWIVVVLLILHAVALVIYVGNYQKERHLEGDSIFAFIKMTQLISKNLSREQVEEVVYYISQQEIGLDDYLVKASLTATPVYDLQFLGEKELLRLKSRLDVLNINQFSYKLGNEWLNFSVAPTFSIYRTALIYIAFELAIIAIIFLFSWSIWRFTAPLRKVKQIVENIGNDLNIHLPAHKKSGPTAVREVSEEIKRMQQRIQSLLDTRTKLVAAIAHDLRTPITRLRLISQFISEPESKKIINNLQEMEHMISSIFAFATIDSAHDKKVKTDISALLDSLYEDYIDMGHEITLSKPKESVLINCRFLAIKRAFVNILENGIKYGKKVHIALEKVSTNKIIVLFEDEGPGIPEHVSDKVFEAYYRLEQSTGKTITGMGLGLTIAYEIIDGHDGNISVENIKPNGLRVKVALPVD